jgi:magnesium Mg(2+) and cobalt Co(2+) transport protein (corA)
MLQILAISKDFHLVKDIPINNLNFNEFSWYWVDFEDPTTEEIALLQNHFNFHPLAIEDCLHILQRPKLDFYNNYNFFVFHSLTNNTLVPEELDVFVGSNFIVTFHKTHLIEIDEVKDKIVCNEKHWYDGSIYAAYLLLDKVVDNYFPSIYTIEDTLNALDDADYSIKTILDQLFKIRGDLLKLRRSIIQMRDLLYRILNSNHLEEFKEKHVFFSDIYDHLLRLSEMIEANMAITAEIRDNYMSINSNKMNSNMMLLTVISSIFIPLTFIVGVYGMNFQYMPELNFKYGYFIVIGIMLAIALSMFYWFKRKGWFDFYK